MIRQFHYIGVNFIRLESISRFGRHCDHVFDPSHRTSSIAKIGYWSLKHLCIKDPIWNVWASDQIRNLYQNWSKFWKTLFIISYAYFPCPYYLQLLMYVNVYLYTFVNIFALCRSELNCDSKFRVLVNSMRRSKNWQIL